MIFKSSVGFYNIPRGSLGAFHEVLISDLHPWGAQLRGRLFGNTGLEHVIKSGAQGAHIFAEARVFDFVSTFPEPTAILALPVNSP